MSETGCSHPPALRRTTHVAPASPHEKAWRLSGSEFQNMRGGAVAAAQETDDFPESETGRGPDALEIRA